MVLGLKRAAVISLCANIGRVEVKKRVLPIINLNQIGKVLVFDVDAPQRSFTFSRYAAAVSIIFELVA